jgi:rhomboid protease GluP
MSAPGAAELAVRVARRRRSADEWALVLLAEGLHPSVSDTRGGFAVQVPPEEAERAEALLASYERESHPVREATPPSADPHALLHALAVSLALVAFFLVTGPRRSGNAFFDRGSADAGRIVGGEIWRAVTALTLHADLGHVLANAAVGALFWSAVARSLGAGLAFALVLAAGAAGNLLNAWAHTGDHVSVGASTAVFGAVGVLVGLALVRRLRGSARRQRAWIPVAAGLALLAMLGTSGDRVDLWAHFFGLLAGAGIGTAAGVLIARPPGPAAQATLASLALALLLLCWTAALGQ